MIPKKWDKVWVDETITTTQAAKILGVSDRTVRRRLENGTIQKVNDKPPYLIRLEDVQKLAGTQGEQIW